MSDQTPDRVGHTLPATPDPVTRYWFDTEFIEDGNTIELISIGVVCEDGREFYAEVDGRDVDLSTADEWVQENVIPHLWHRQADKAEFNRWIRAGGTGGLLTRAHIAGELLKFVNRGAHRPEFWAYYADYDWVVLCQLYGRMIDLPKSWPMFCRDIKQEAARLGDPTLPEQSSTEHHALADARWNREAHEFLEALAVPGEQPAPSECPVCGSKDPRVRNAYNVDGSYRQQMPCTNPWHRAAPSPDEQPAASWVQAEDGWGYDGLATTSEAVRTASAVVVVPTFAGGAQIELHAGGVDIEIEVLPDGTIGEIDIERLAPSPDEDTRRERPRIYLASKACHGARWQDIARRADNAFDVCSSWIYESGPGETADMSELWVRCIADVVAADAVVAFHEQGEEWKGAFVEIGAALALGKPVYVVGDPPGSWVNHPLVERRVLVMDACRDAAAAHLRETER